MVRDRWIRERMAVLAEMPYLMHDMYQWRMQENAPPQGAVTFHRFDLAGLDEACAALAPFTPEAVAARVRARVDRARVTSLVSSGSVSAGDVGMLLSVGLLVEARTALQSAGIDYDSADSEFVPNLTVDVDAETARKLFRLIDALETRRREGEHHAREESAHRHRKAADLHQQGGTQHDQRRVAVGRTQM